jgi:hypothetical protein
MFTVYQWILPTEFISSVILLVKITRHCFFCFVLIIFFHCNSLGIYRGNISVSKIHQKFTDENILLVFLFVFINFPVVLYCLEQNEILHI